jgi:hypothetical protein
LTRGNDSAADANDLMSSFWNDDEDMYDDDDNNYMTPCNAFDERLQIRVS